MREGLNLREISELTGISYNTLTSYRQGKRVPKMKMIYKIATHPRLAKYKELLLSDDDYDRLTRLDYPTENPLSDQETHFLELMRDLKAKGKEADALAILEALAKTPDGQ